MDCNSAVVCSIVACDLHPCHESELCSFYDTNKGVSTDVDEKTGRECERKNKQCKRKNKITISYMRLNQNNHHKLYDSTTSLVSFKSDSILKKSVKMLSYILEFQI